MTRERVEASRDSTFAEMWGGDDSSIGAHRGLHVELHLVGRDRERGVDRDMDVEAQAARHKIVSFLNSISSFGSSRDLLESPWCQESPSGELEFC